MIFFGKFLRFFVWKLRQSVPSELCDYLKSGNNAITLSIIADEEAKYILSPVEEPDMEELSKADVECLKEAVDENYGLSFYELSNKSHDRAWHKAWHKATGKRGGKMDIIDIAKAAGADDKTIEYIQEELELEEALK